MSIMLIRINLDICTGKDLSLDVKANDTIQNIKAKIEDKEGVSSNQQHLIYGGRELTDNKTLKDYNIQKESYLRLLVFPIYIIGSQKQMVFNKLMYSDNNHEFKKHMESKGLILGTLDLDDQHFMMITKRYIQVSTGIIFVVDINNIQNINQHLQIIYENITTPSMHLKEIVDRHYNEIVPVLIVCNNDKYNKVNKQNVNEIGIKLGLYKNSDYCKLLIAFCEQIECPLNIINLIIDYIPTTKYDSPKFLFHIQSCTNFQDDKLFQAVITMTSFQKAKT
eukprot:189610_1